MLKTSIALFNYDIEKINCKTVSHNQMDTYTPGWNDLPFHNPDKINACVCNAA